MRLGRSLALPFFQKAIALNLWGVEQGPQFEGDLFGKFRASRLFELSRTRYEPGWTTQDRIGDPVFMHLPADGSKPADLQLKVRK